MPYLAVLHTCSRVVISYCQSAHSKFLLLASKYYSIPMDMPGGHSGNVRSSSWRDSSRSECSGSQYTCSDGSTFTAGLVTPKNLIQQQAHTPTTSESRSHTGCRYAQDYSGPTLSFATSSSIPIRAPDHSVPVSQGPWNIRRWALDIEKSIPPGPAQNSRNASMWSNLDKDPISGPAEKGLDTPQTYSPGTPKLDPGHVFATVIDEVKTTAVEEFCSIRGSPSTKSSRVTYPHHFRTNTHSNAHIDPAISASLYDPDEGDTVLFEHAKEEGPQIWPCPFFVKDKQSHISCLTRHCLLSMTDVREHLCLMHRNPIYCSVCYETFPTVKLRDAHMRGWRCPPQTPVIFEGITDAQVHALDEQQDAAVMKTASELEQWLEIWKIVFPSTRPPCSPWSFTRRELEVYELRRFWKRFGENLISHILQKYGFQGYNIENEERNLEALFSVAADRAVDSLLLIQMCR